MTNHLVYTRRCAMSASLLFHACVQIFVLASLLCSFAVAHAQTTSPKSSEPGKSSGKKMERLGADTTLPGGTVPGGSVPGGTLPEARSPAEPCPVGPFLVELVPGGTLPGGTVPGGPVPGGTLPGGTVPGGTVPGGTLP